MIRRRQDWASILSRMIGEAHGKPFAWGSHDCCLWACNIVRAMSVDGIDLAAGLRGGYCDAAGAACLLKARAGLENLAAKITSHHGLGEVAPLFAWRGDIVLADTGLGPSIGIMADAGAAFVAQVGLTILPRAALGRAWRVA